MLVESGVSITYRDSASPVAISYSTARLSPAARLTHRSQLPADD